VDDLDEHRIRPGELASAKKRARKPVAITAMVTETERDLVDQAAADAGLSRAAWARQVLLAAASSTGLPKIPTEHE